LWAYIGQAFVILSLAELASIAPTSSSHCHWVSELAPRRAQRSLSYCTGWLAWVGWQGVVAVDCLIISEIVQMLIALNIPSYVPQHWHAMLLMVAVGVGFASFQMLAGNRLSLLEGLFAIVHVYAFVPIVFTLWVMAPSASAGVNAFMHFHNGGGWPSTTLSVLVGQLPSMFIWLGSDAVTHLAEEVEDAARLVPQSMVRSYLLNAPLTFLLVLTYGFNCGSLIHEVDFRISYPFLYVFRHAVRSTAITTGLAVVVLALLAMITTTAIASTSRLTIAFARDRGLPFSRWIRRRNRTIHAPVNALLLTTAFTSALSIVLVGCTSRLHVVLALATGSLMAAYILSIGCMLVKRLRQEHLPHARWSLGRAGLPINILGVAYASWCCFWAFWPSYYNVGAADFNWAIVILVMIMSVASVLLWSGKVDYRPPVLRVRPWMNAW
ncbi:MAG: hypothetical protein FE78DRAFT_70127, partial [Acidomyces sp. 'richmondensis']